MRNSYSARCGDEKRGIDMKWSELKPKKMYEAGRRENRKINVIIINLSLSPLFILRSPLSPLAAALPPSLSLLSLYLSLSCMRSFDVSCVVHFFLCFFFFCVSLLFPFHLRVRVWVCSVAHCPRFGFGCFLFAIVIMSMLVYVWCGNICKPNHIRRCRL